MAEGIDQAAAAFDASMKLTEKPSKPGKAPSEANMPPSETLFSNVGELDRDTDLRGGGDDEVDPEELIYGKSKNPPRTPSKEDDGDEQGDADGPDGDNDDESDDGDQAEEGEEEATGPDAEILGRKVEVTIDGEPAEVSIKEAIEGYVRTETFHRRMNQLDEAKKIVRRAAADAVQNYEYSMNIAKQMEAHMNEMIPKEPNWDEEFQKDPAKARDLQRYYEKANGFRQQMRQQMSEVANRQVASNQAQLAAFAEEESSKFESMNRKNWSDPKKKVKDLESMRRTGLAAKFSEEELSQVYDSRMLEVLLKASKYDRMMAAKPKPVIRQPAKPIPPGTGSAKQRTVQRGVTSAMKRLNKTGSMDDAAVVFDQIIARG